jgi:hypothetical protein
MASVFYPTFQLSSIPVFQLMSLSTMPQALLDIGGGRQLSEPAKFNIDIRQTKGPADCVL